MHGNTDALHKARIVCPEKTILICPTIRLAQDLLAKPLRGLHLPQRTARRRRYDNIVLRGNLDRILLGYGDNRRPLRACHADELLNRLTADQRTRRIVHEYNVCFLRDNGKSVTDRVLPLGAALNHLPRSKPLHTAEKPLHRIDLIRSDGNDQFTDLGHLGKREQRPQEHRFARERQKDLIQPRIHPMCLPRRREDNTNHIFPSCAPCDYRVSFAKIMRPAAVCSAEVTSTDTTSFMQRNPPSTTIIVPSSR